MNSPARKINGSEPAEIEEADPKAMADDDLAQWLRFFLESPNVPYRAFALDVIASHEHHARRAKALEERVRQLEERCALDAEDIKEHRVTLAQVSWWASSHGWSRVIRSRSKSGDRVTWWERAGKRDIQVNDGANALAYAIDELAVADSRNAWDVLREMAAIQVPGTTN
jgi:hypothetical protein